MPVEHVPDALERMDDWVNRIARSLPSPIRASLEPDHFHLRYPKETVEVLLVCKAVRMVSALHGAWALSLQGLTAEVGSLARTVADFSDEIWFMASTLFPQGKSNSDQKKFKEDFFEPPIRNLQGYLERERSHYVSRGNIAKLNRSVSEDLQADSELLEGVSAFLLHSLNIYVHGSYESAMQLYDEGAETFRVAGLAGGPTVESSQEFVARMGTDVCVALRVLALTLGKSDVSNEIRSYLDEVGPVNEMDE